MVMAGKMVDTCPGYTAGIPRDKERWYDMQRSYSGSSFLCHMGFFCDRCTLKDAINHNSLFKVETKRGWFPFCIPALSSGEGDGLLIIFPTHFAPFAGSCLKLQASPLDLCPPSDPLCARTVPSVSLALTWSKVICATCLQVMSQYFLLSFFALL